MLKILKEILLVVRSIHDSQIKENRSDRMASLERTVEILKGNLEVKEQRLRAMEKYLGVEFKQESKYEKNSI